MALWSDSVVISINRENLLFMIQFANWREEPFAVWGAGYVSVIKRFKQTLTKS